LSPAPPGKQIVRTGRAVGHTVQVGLAKATQGADSLEPKLSKPGKWVLHKASLLDPAALMGFAVKKIAADRAFLAVYGPITLFYSNVAAIPIFMSMGFDVASAMFWRVVSGVALDISAIAIRKHMKRPDKAKGIGHTLETLSNDYGKHRRETSESRRRFAREYEGTLLENLGKIMAGQRVGCRSPGVNCGKKSKEGKEAASE
jgi:hypothetical protein